MQREREPFVEVILEPAPTSDRVGEKAEEGRDSGHHPAADNGSATVYTGPERRAQGYLVAEIIPDSSPLDGRTTEIDRSR
jgi:hypothetical protein